MPDAAPARLTGDLIRTRELLPADVEAAITAYLEKPSPGPIALGEAYAIDVADAIAAHPASARLLAEPETAGKPGLQRTVVRTAILLARQEKA